MLHSSCIGSTLSQCTIFNQTGRLFFPSSIFQFTFTSGFPLTLIVTFHLLCFWETIRITISRIQCVGHVAVIFTIVVRFIIRFTTTLQRCTTFKLVCTRDDTDIIFRTCFTISKWVYSNTSCHSLIHLLPTTRGNTITNVKVTNNTIHLLSRCRARFCLYQCTIIFGQIII